MDDAEIIRLVDVITEARRNAAVAEVVFESHTITYTEHYNAWTAERDVRDAAQAEVTAAKAALDAAIDRR